MTRKQVSARSQQHHQRMRSTINNSRRPGKVKGVVHQTIGPAAKKKKGAMISSLYKVSGWRRAPKGNCVRPRVGPGIEDPFPPALDPSEVRHCSPACG